MVASNFDDWPFLSVHYWGEKAEGRWTLQIINTGNRHVNQPGELIPDLYCKLLGFFKFLFSQPYFQVF